MPACEHKTRHLPLKHPCISFAMACFPFLPLPLHTHTHTCTHTRAHTVLGTATVGSNAAKAMRLTWEVTKGWTPSYICCDGDANTLADPSVFTAATDPVGNTAAVAFIVQSPNSPSRLTVLAARGNQQIFQASMPIPEDMQVRNKQRSKAANTEPKSGNSTEFTALYSSSKKNNNKKNKKNKNK